MNDFVEQMKPILLKQQAIEMVDVKSKWLDLEHCLEWDIEAHAKVLAGRIDPAYRPAKRARDDTKWGIIEKYAGKEIDPSRSPMFQL